MNDLPPNVSMVPTFDDPALKPRDLALNADLPLIEKVTKTILFNQEKRYDDTDPDHMRSLLGPDFKDKIRKAIYAASMNTPLWETVSTQPLTQPIGLLFFMKSTYTADQASETSTSIPEVKLSIESDATAAVTRRLGSTIEKGFTQHQLNNTFIKALDEFRLEVFGDLMLSGEKASNDCAIGSDLDPVELTKYAVMIHKQTMRGPANTILCHPKHEAVLKLSKSRFKVITDWQFPEDKLTMWYSGLSVLDQPYIIAPYYFSLLKYDDDRAGIALRYGKKLIHEDHIITLEIKD